MSGHIDFRYIVRKQPDVLISELIERRYGGVSPKSARTYRLSCWQQSSRRNWARVQARRPSGSFGAISIKRAKLSKSLAMHPADRFASSMRLQRSLDP
jgi:hypothetical protein